MRSFRGQQYGLTLHSRGTAQKRAAPQFERYTDEVIVHEFRSERITLPSILAKAF